MSSCTSNMQNNAHLCAFWDICLFLEAIFQFFTVFHLPFDEFFASFWPKSPFCPKLRTKVQIWVQGCSRLAKILLHAKNQPSTPKTAQPTPSPIDLDHCALGVCTAPLRHLQGQNKSWTNEKRLLTKIVRYVSEMTKITTTNPQVDPAGWPRT